MCKSAAKSANQGKNKNDFLRKCLPGVFQVSNDTFGSAMFSQVWYFAAGVWQVQGSRVQSL